jgi:hypothetical protein
LQSELYYAIKGLVLFYQPLLSCLVKIMFLMFLPIYRPLTLYQPFAFGIPSFLLILKILASKLKCWSPLPKRDSTDRGTTMWRWNLSSRFRDEAPMVITLAGFTEHVWFGHIRHRNIYISVVREGVEIHWRYDGHALARYFPREPLSRTRVDSCTKKLNIKSQRKEKKKNPE